MARRVTIEEVEAPPEADRLEPFPHPRHTARLIGHAGGVDALMAGARADRLHHGWLLAGPEGIGKATLAYRFAAWLLAAPDERADEPLTLHPGSRTLRQVQAQSHASLLVIRRQWDFKGKRFQSVVSVDDVRRLRGFLGHTGTGEGWRVVIVDPADELNTAAANALLKSLEEPPARTVFLLLAADPGRLLPTIRSRCRKLVLAPLARDDLWEAAGQAMTAADVEPPLPDDRARLTLLADGSVRRFLALAHSGGLAADKAVERALTLLPKVDWPAVHTLADQVAAASEEGRFDQFCDLVQGRLYRYLRIAAGGSGETSEVDAARRLIKPADLATWAELWERIGRDRAETDALNLDRRTFVVNLFARLESAARR